MNQYKYIINIECPIEHVNGMLEDLTDPKSSVSMMVYPDYWSLLTRILDSDNTPIPAEAFKTEEAADEFSDLCVELLCNAIGEFSNADGTLTVERGDSDSLVELYDYVNPDLVKAEYLDELLPWRRKDLAYIADWMGENVLASSGAKVGDIDCYIFSGPMTWGSTVEFAFKTDSERLARKLNIIKATYETLEVNTEYQDEGSDEQEEE